VTLLFKGSRTIVAQRDRPLSYNITGNPGMATGGMGDILTGVCAGLVGQGLSLYDAARVGAWLCGARRKSQFTMMAKASNHCCLAMFSIIWAKRLKNCRASVSDATGWRLAQTPYSLSS